MQFSLKQVILFTTFAAMLSVVVIYFYVQTSNSRRAGQQAQNFNVQTTIARRAEETQREKKLAAEIAEQPIKHSILHWNIEPSGNDPIAIARQLIALGEYDIIGLSEVARPEVYESAINKQWPSKFGFVRGTSGGSDKRLIIFNRHKFDLVASGEIKEVRGWIKFNNGIHPAPLYAKLKDKNKATLIVYLNLLKHMARLDSKYRTRQASALRKWSWESGFHWGSAIIAIGDYNFDYDHNTGKGIAGFDEFLKYGDWRWIKPVEMIDTEWSDGNDVDRYPESILDFNFVSGGAKYWKAECRVIVPESDFPDDKKTSGHRPVELILDPENFIPPDIDNEVAQLVRLSETLIRRGGARPQHLKRGIGMQAYRCLHNRSAREETYFKVATERYRDCLNEMEADYPFLEKNASKQFPFMRFGKYKQKYTTLMVRAIIDKKTLWADEYGRGKPFAGRGREYLVSDIETGGFAIGDEIHVSLYKFGYDRASNRFLLKPFKRAEELKQKIAEAGAEFPPWKEFYAKVRSRQWKDENGQSVTGYFKDYVDGNVIIVSDGKEQKLDVSTLYSRDAKWLKDWLDVLKIAEELELDYVRDF